MSVEFTEEQDLAESTASQMEKPGGIAGWLVDNGIAKNARQASYIVLAVALVFAALTVFIVYRALSGNSPSPTVVAPERANGGPAAPQ
jgi:hypothetical protein